MTSKKTVQMVLDARPMPQGKMPPRAEIIKKMQHQLFQEGIPQIEVLHFCGCAQYLSDDQLFKAATMFWEARGKETNV